MLRIAIYTMSDMRRRQRERGVANQTFEKEPFLFEPNYIKDATLEYIDDAMPIKRFMEERLTRIECPAGVAPQYYLTEFQMFDLFIKWRMDERVTRVMKWDQQVLFAALTAQDCVCKGGGLPGCHKNDRRKAFWNWGFKELPDSLNDGRPRF